MADLVITAANVKQGSAAQIKQGIAGEVIAAGKSVFIDTADGNKIKLADNGAEASAKAEGIASNNAAADQPISYQTAGNIDLGATLIVAERYFVSNTAGGIKPEADLLSGERVSLLGIASAANNLAMSRVNSGTVVP